MHHPGISIPMPSTAKIGQCWTGLMIVLLLYYRHVARSMGLKA
jgi:hypothetical protein